MDGRHAESLKSRAALIFLAVVSLPKRRPFAGNIAKKAHTSLRDLDMAHGGSDRAELVKASLNAMPMEAWDSMACAIMLGEGAHCAASEDGQTCCVCSSFEVSDHLHQLVWTVQPNGRHGADRGL